MLLNAPSFGPTNRRDWQTYATPPLGTMYMASVLIQEGLSVSAYDLEVTDISPIKLLNEVKEKKIQVLGLSCVTVSFKNACRIAALIKQGSPDTLIVIGGPHVTYMIRETLMFRGIDAVAYGEGEYIIRDLCHNLTNGKNAWQETRGIAFRRDDGDIQINLPHDIVNDLDTLPYPALHLLELDKYYSPGIIMTARGCPFRCQFCSESMTGNHDLKIRKGYRLRSIANVIGEIENYLYIYGISQIFFADDTLTINRDRTLELCEELIDLRYKARSKKEFTFSCESQVDMITEDLVQALSEAGCTGIQFGLESGSQEILDSIHKGTKLNQYQDVVRWCAKYGIKTTLSFMLPNPTDSENTFKETKKFLQEIYDLGADSFAPSLTTPYPGTELYHRRDELGLTILTDDWDVYNCNTPIVTTRNFGSGIL